MRGWSLAVLVAAVAVGVVLMGLPREHSLAIPLAVFGLGFVAGGWLFATRLGFAIPHSGSLHNDTMLREIESRLTHFETSELLTQAAAIYMDRGKRAKAQQFLERALEIATDEALRTRYLLGQLYLERNEPKKAWPLFDAVYRVDNTYQFGEIKLWAARTYLALQEPQVAETLADEFLQRERGHALALGIKGDALWAQSRYVDAKEVYRELLDGLANASGKNHDKYRDLERTARRRLAE